MFTHKLHELRGTGLQRNIKDRASGQRPRISIGTRELVNFSSNDYLGLASHPEVVRAAREAIEKFGFGGGASRLLAGGTDMHKELEEITARFKGTEASLVFNSGYAANTGIIPAIAEKGDVVFSDELNHASIVDGCRLSGARTFIFNHRDVEHLSYLMKKEKGNRKVVVTDTVFSMDGDIAPLKDIYNVCLAHNSASGDRHSSLLYIDDAHGTGVLGNGKGALSHFNICLQPWIIQMGTFSKALGSLGAFIAGNSEVIDWLVNTARSFFFSTALPACVVAASAKAIELIGKEPELIDKLWTNRDRLVAELLEKGFDISGSETPIIPLKTKSNEDALRLSQQLYDKGIYAPAIRPPTVKSPRVRITVTAAHSEKDLAALVGALQEINTAGS